jgi:hypothetical protein
MQRFILAAVVLGFVSMVTPRQAAAQVSFDVGTPGFSLHAGPPVYPPPVVVAPPAVVYQPPVYYGYGPPPKHYWKHWDHWDKHHWKHGHGHGDHDDD